MSIQDEIKKRRTFAIISHPDAGKTTITEQLLYFGGEIREAGTVKGKKTGNFAKSDWMDIEKQRGISVTSSVMQFDYAGKRVNILDTPGHEAFTEMRARGANITDISISAGAGFVVVYTGNVLTMPGLPKVPAAVNMGVDENGETYGLF